jgi:hypothetical protein
MARRPEPRWYQSRGGWYVCIGGKQHRLAVGKESKAEAWKAYHRLMLEGRGPAKGQAASGAGNLHLVQAAPAIVRRPLRLDEGG